jgi:CubicO group peptidase (beta-lactamase class C family)
MTTRSPTTTKISIAAAVAALALLVTPALGQIAQSDPSPDATITLLMQRSHVAGATIAIVKDGKILSLRGYGLRDLAAKTPADAHTQYETGSVTREFTAVAIAQLNEAGKIDLDAPVARYVPSAPHASAITVRQLLDNTSGLPPYGGSDFQTLAHTPTTFAQLMARISDKPLDFAPGTATAYSITNTLLLGRIVEIVSGESWSTYLATHLFARAGMTESATIAQEGTLANMARGYTYAHGQTAPAQSLDDSWVLGSGDIVTTAGDLVKWHQALDTGRIVSAKDLQLLALPDIVQGDTFGFDATDAFFPDRHERIVVLTNTTNDIVGDSPSEEIAETVDAPPATAAEPSAQALYARAVATMDRVSQPPFVTYELQAQNDAIHVGLQTAGGNVWLLFQGGSAPTDWSVKHRTQDYESEVIDEGNRGARYISARPFFDPTWFGAFRALRDGMLGYQNPDPQRDALTIAEPTAAPDASLHTIAAVSVIGPSVYAVTDRGPTACPNGDPGHALHLVPRHHDPREQLSDVTVDLHSMRFCMLRFRWSTLWFTGLVEQHYADVGGYWIVTDGSLDGTTHLLGIKMHRFIWDYRLNNMTFPQQLPPDTFNR